MSFNPQGDPNEGVTTATKIFDEYGKFIRSIFRWQVDDEHQTEDLFQEFFLVMASRNMPEAVSKKYIYRAAINFIIDFRRKKSRYSNAVSRYGSDKYEIIKEQPEDQMLKNEEALRIMDILNSHLNFCEATAIQSRLIHQLSTQETAEQMNVKPRTVSRYLSTGLNKIRTYLTNSSGINL